MDFKLATRTVILAVAGTAFPLAALAQWQWIDTDGRKVFSDRSPPADILEKNILKQPGGKAPSTPSTPSSTDNRAAAPAPAALASATASKASAPRLVGKDAQLEARKKQADALEETTKLAEEEKLAKARTDNCERAQKAQATLRSGARISLTNVQGEREVMDDTARAEETRRLQAIAQSNCGQ